MRSNMKLLIALSLASLLTPLPLLAAEGFSGSVEVGAAGVSIEDSQLRVNEYNVIRPDDGVTAYGKAAIESHSNGLGVDLGVDVMGVRDQKYGLDFDLYRALKLESSFQAFGRWTDHDQMNYLNAAIPAPPAGGGVGTLVTPDNVPGYVDSTTGLGVAAGTANSQQVGRAGLYGEDFMKNDDFFITHRNLENEVSLTIPQLPQVTFHAGYRIEQREGMEQSIGMSKCTTCHITGMGKQIDEETKDLTVGLTGRFGALTVDYEYLDREFRENAGDAERVYDPALAPSPGTTYTPGNAVFDNRLLYDYEDGALAYDVTPDSDKESHVLKARVALPGRSEILGSYVSAEVESKINDEPGIWTMAEDKLTTTYDGYGLKAATRIGDKIRLTLRGKVEELEDSAANVTFFPMGTTAQPNLGGGTLPASIAATRHSVVTRDVLSLGADLVYRLARKSTLRLSYDFKEDDREYDHFGKTETHTAKAAIKMRPAKNLSARVSVEYEKTKNPLQNSDAAGYIDPITGLPYTDAVMPPTGIAIGNGPLYGTAYYDLRQTDLSNLPEDSYEGKVNLTWAPSSDFSGSFNLRVLSQENALDRSEWKQLTYVPGASLWYAANEKVDLTFAYTYMGQSTEAKFCQGWYDG